MDGRNPAFRVSVSYIDKSREFYAAQGYPQPYRWACNTDSPFVRLPKPLSECSVGLITTTTRLGPGENKEIDPEEREPKAPYAEPSGPRPAAMYTADLSWDKEATHTDDVESFLPLRALSGFADAGRIASPSDRFYGVPTEYSQRRTIEFDAPAIARYLRDDSVDVAILVPL